MVTMVCPKLARPVTPPRHSSQPGVFECNVEYEGQLYLMQWGPLPVPPHLHNFPDVNANVFLVEESPDMASLRRNSALLDFDCHSCTRRVNSAPYPIVKIAHPDDESMAILQYEFGMLTQLSQFNLPIPAFSDAPIYDYGKFRGYQMEELSKMTYSEKLFRWRDIQEAVAKFHAAGFTYGGLKARNLMKNHEGAITLINVGCSGPIGEVIPPTWVPSWAYTTKKFDISADITELELLLLGRD